MELTPRRARLMAEIKQEEMAKLLRMHRATYIEKEKEPGKFTVEEARQFCKVTDTRLDEVFGDGRATK